MSQAPFTAGRTNWEGKKIEKAETFDDLAGCPRNSLQQLYLAAFGSGLAQLPRLIHGILDEERSYHQAVQQITSDPARSNKPQTRQWFFNPFATNDSGPEVQADHAPERLRWTRLLLVALTEAAASGNYYPKYCMLADKAAYLQNAM